VVVLPKGKSLDYCLQRMASNAASTAANGTVADDIVDLGSKRPKKKPYQTPRQFQQQQEHLAKMAKKDNDAKRKKNAHLADNVKLLGFQARISHLNREIAEFKQRIKRNPSMKQSLEFDITQIEAEKIDLERQEERLTNKQDRKKQRKKMAAF